ncbi:serine/threonine-protein kinase Kic1p [[Candida] jaroonii]|uniref:Serine/threonine-protein kinase Kic1p n=1 Tax=[Candida] jaroonii TaxID=467808 RepID=A0ACA9Y516_9ASCO|nr:serine/threonine-protein kinase Kic1p [[Candida] jaroonii]
MSSTTLFKRTEVIGRGKFGIVYKGYNKQTKQVVAIKVLNLDTQEDEVADVQQEIQFLAELKNVPNVTHYYGSILNDTKLWIIMDYCAGGSVRTLLKAGVFEEKYIGVIARELLIGLSAVHKMGVIHRDLKAANVLISKEGNVQLCDFGVAAKISSNSLKRTTMAGTPYWMAPEVIREGDTYNSKADIWSLGITLYETATGDPPYSDKDAMWAMQMISKSTPPRLEGRDYSPNLKEAIALCLDENPEERPSADDLLKCKLIRFYKNHSTSILKEVITKYLLWRDSNNKRRDSIAFISLENDIGQENETNLEGDNIQVKWDFDSLSSREYIIENDIDINQVEDKFDATYDMNDGDHYQTQPTLKPGAFNDNTVGNTFGKTSSNNNTITNSQSNPNIPKSLQSLFEESPEIEASHPNDIPHNFDLPPPGIGTLNESRTESSPTIEIPDIDELPNLTSVASLNTNSSQPHLSKPPTLYHSQSASGNLETRFNSSSSLGSSTLNTHNNRPRKKTISNSYGSVSSSQLTSSNSNTAHSTLNTTSNQFATPHTPPYSNNSTTSPSPKPPSTTTFASNTNSPSKSMKALQTTSNPLLQPINFKSQETNHPPANDGKSKMRPRPGLHIQMPTPNNASSLSALTNNQFEEPEINQFGVKPAQVGNLSMTPVTEKDSFIEGSNPPTEEKNTTPQFRERASSLSTQRTHLPQRKMTAPSIQTPNSLSIPKQLTSSLSPSNFQKVKFPTIPNINTDMFSDSTPKQKLVSELDSMIKLFNVGLEALEEKI